MTNTVSLAPAIEQHVPALFLDDSQVDYSKAPTPMEFAVAAMIPMAEVSVLAAESNVGKTHSMLDLALSIAKPDKPRKFLGNPVLVSGPVMILSAEETREQLIGRMNLIDAQARTKAAMGGHPIYYAGKGDLRGQVLFEGPSCQATGLFDDLRSWAMNVRPKLIFLDTASTIAAVNLDANNDTAAAMMRRLGLLATETGAAVVLAHHFAQNGKPTDWRNAAAAVRGAGSIVNVSRSTIVVTHAPQDVADRAVDAGLSDKPYYVKISCVPKLNDPAWDPTIKVLVRDTVNHGYRDVTHDVPYFPGSRGKSSASSDVDVSAVAKPSRGRPKKAA